MYRSAEWRDIVLYYVIFLQLKILLSTMITRIRFYKFLILFVVNTRFWLRHYPYIDKKLFFK